MAVEEFSKNDDVSLHRSTVSRPTFLRLSGYLLSRPRPRTRFRNPSTYPSPGFRVEETDVDGGNSTQPSTANSERNPRPEIAIQVERVIPEVSVELED